jgi:hypothetical protein
MPFRWVKTEGFKYKPYSCIACGQAPMKDDGSGPEDAVWMEGADVNWGDYLQLCSSCVRIVGELMGMLDPEKVGELKLRIRELEKRLQESEGDRDEYKSLNETMLAGAKARKRSKEMTNA